MYIKWLQIGNNHFEFKKRSVSLRNVLKSVFSKKVSAAVLTAVMLFVSVFSMSMIASAASFSPRLSAPSSSNKYYYSNLNVFYRCDYGMPNCTAYAYGRAYEILGSEPKLSWNNAEQWYGYNKANGYYKYGQTPKVGAIACWSYNGGGGHVAVVEKVENGQITFSNSAWSGDNFYISTASISDPKVGGNKGWNFQGYIYLGDFSGSTSTTQATTKKVTYTTGTYKTNVDDYLKMRSGAGTSYSSIAFVPNNVTLNVTKVSTAGGYTWGYTSYNGKTGWVALDFCAFVSSSTVQPTTAKPAVQPTTAKATVQPTTAKATVQPTTAKATQPATVQPTTVQATTAPVTTQPSNDNNNDTPYMIGDVNLDGHVNVIDATEISKYIVSISTLSDVQRELADYNHDGEINVVDATEVQKFVVGNN
jgi:surface antigen/uncharacterized protein YraI